MSKFKLIFFALLLGLGLTVDAQRLFVTDSAGVEREVSRLFVTDSGSTEREIQRLFVIDSGGTARLVFQRSTDFVLTVGDANPDFGYTGSGTGSIDPTPPKFDGNTINSIFSGSVDFEVVIVGSQAQSLFTSIVVEDGGGIERTYNSADADSFTAGATSVWKWGLSGLDPVWEFADVSENHSVSFL